MTQVFGKALGDIVNFILSMKNLSKDGQVFLFHLCHQKNPSATKMSNLLMNAGFILKDSLKN